MKKLQKMRLSAGLSQSQLAQKAGVSVRTLQDYEQGHTDFMGASIRRALKLAQALGCRIEDLID